MPIYKVNEPKRTIMFVNGTTQYITNVTEVEVGSTFLRLKCDQGYLLLNPRHIMAMLIDGEKVF